MEQLFLPFDPFIVNEGFGWSAWRNAVHNGLDISAAQGTQLRATASGTVTRHYSDQWGAGIDIRRADDVVVRHWHLSQFIAEAGQYVNAGDVIGLTGGATGSWGAGFSTGAHLHWGTQVNGAWVDPMTLNPVSFDQLGKEEDDMARPMYFCAVSDSPSGIVKKNNIFVRNQPGEPLLRLTDGQWSDWYWRDRPDKDVVYKNGAWFDEAFKEDNLVHAVNVNAHPWMAETSGSSGGATASQIAVAVENQLKDEFASIPKTVNDDVAKRMGS